MGVITISRGSYSKGKEIAEKLSNNLQYECFSRDVLFPIRQYFHRTLLPGCALRLQQW